ncbi:MAG: PAS domain S-box protein [Anaerolineae bacterium]|nr:PAS domain S-box protein [Anaerolineae bacterium]
MNNEVKLCQEAKRRLLARNIAVDSLTQQELQTLVCQLEIQKMELERHNEELIRSRQTLESTRDVYTHLFENAPVGYVILDENAIILKVNTTFAEMLGRNKVYIRDRNLAFFMLPEDNYLFKQQLEAINSSKGKFSAKIRFYRADGRILHIQLTGIRDTIDPASEPTPHQLHLTFTDISRHIQVEKALHKSWAFGHTILNSLKAHIAVVSLDGTLITVNDAWLRFGQTNQVTSLEKIGVGANYLNVCRQAAKTDEQARNVLAGIEAVLKGLLPSFSYTYHFDVDGTANWYFMDVMPLQEVTGGAVIVHINITPQRQAEEQVKQLNQKLADERNLLRTLLDTLPDYVYLKDRESRFITGNLPIAKTMGVETVDALVGKTDFDFYPRELATKFYNDEQNVIHTGKPIFDEEERLVNAEGISCWNSTSKVPLKNHNGEITGVIGVSRDITKRREMSDQLRQAQKMEAVGQLANGIAHHFNNMLTVLMGHVAFALDAIPPDHPLATDLGRIQLISERAAALTHQLLAFARKEEFRPRLVNLNHVITFLETIIKPMLHQTITLFIVLDPALESTKVDVNQFEQLLVSLIVNACEAMPDGGELSLKTANLELPTTKVYSHIEIPPGSYITLKVIDTGIGMSDAIQERIFEPFFTTKEVGQGTGLGLSSCYGIVHQHQGYITVESQPNQGATFSVFFPVRKT